MLCICCRVQRDTLVAATRHIRSSASSFIHPLGPPLPPPRPFPPPVLGPFAGEGVASAAAAGAAGLGAAAGAAALAARADACDIESVAASMSAEVGEVWGMWTANRKKGD